MCRAIFLDKDGTLIEDVPYNVDPGRIRLMPGAAEGLRLLHGLGYRLLIVTNQSGVARGYFPEQALAGVEARLRELLAQVGVPLAGFYYCPHHPNGSVRAYAVHCDCRKPMPGLITRGGREHGIDLRRSWLVGDKLDDIEAGRRAGCRTVLLGKGHQSDGVLPLVRLPDHVTPDLAEAVRLIVSAAPALS
jgi:histidinol-phosphate phosphatase family protein